MAAATRRRTPLAPACPRPHSCPRPVRVRVLGKVPLFADLTAAQLEEVADRCTAKGYAEGATIYSAGTAAHHLFVLAAGRIKITRPRGGGGDVVVDVVLPGGLFGALPTLGQPAYEETAQALTTSCALAISTAEFERFLRRYPPVALAVIGVLSERLADARGGLQRLSGESVQVRLAATLLALAERAGHERGGGTLLQLPLSRTDLARMSAATPESVSRALSGWKRAGIIDSGRRWIAIRDRAALEDLASRA